jgi:hypothetical protein
MFRRSNSGRGPQSLLGGGGGGGSLPMTGLSGKYRRNPNTSFLAFIANIFDRSSTKKMDGSAASIHIGPTVGQAWERASIYVKITWIMLFTTIFAIYFGYRYIRFYNSGLLFDCLTTTCTVRLVHQGWNRPTVSVIGRHQLIRTEPVKVNKDGTFVSGNASIQVDYSKSKYNPKTHGVSYTDSLNYKGADENGHYLSYALYFKDKNSTEQYTSQAQEILNEEHDLAKLKPYLTKVDNDEYRIIVKQQVPVSFLSKRRIRTMTQKIDSYIKKRRNHMIARETSGPAWQGIVLLVFGIMGFLLTLLLGQFQDESPYATSGPGIRRQQQQYQRETQRYQKDRYDNVLHARQTPIQYEVRTAPSKIPPPKGQVQKTTTTSARAVSSSSSASSAPSQASHYASKIGFQSNVTTASRRR